jgi:hypothetical protein
MTDDVAPWVAEWAENQSEEAHELADRIEPILRERVRHRKDPRIRYAELSQKLGRYHRDPTFLTALGLVSHRTLLRDGYALSALVVNESGLPGDSFYSLVGGSDKPDEAQKMRLFIEQFNKITGEQ